MSPRAHFRWGLVRVRRLALLSRPFWNGKTSARDPKPLVFAAGGFVILGRGKGGGRDAPSGTGPALPPPTYCRSRGRNGEKARFHAGLRGVEFPG